MKYKFTKKFIDALSNETFCDITDTAPSKIELTKGCWLCCNVGLGNDHIARILIDTELLPSEWFKEEKNVF